jgi:hypothetical protein
LKEVPVEYNFMKRYPPILAHKQNAMRRLEAQKIPYMKIYDKVVERNPLYVDERIYPAYWEHDTTPLAIAKRQYDLMQQGLTEEEAYFKALEYVEQIEADAYDAMEKMLLSIQSLNGSLSYVSDAKVKADIEKFRNKLQLFYYNELDLGEQGEVDYIIHKHILKWNPVQTEIRMKDPVFVMMFNELRAAVFPSIATEGEEEEGKNAGDDKVGADSKEGGSSSSSAAKLTNAPFHYEEYLELFNKLKAQPAIGRWTNAEREKLLKWVYETLALRDSVDRSVGAELQRYLDEVRDTFFPMIRFPELAPRLSLPDSAAIRQVLYNQQIGYRTDGNKLFIRRFYKLPRILFPAETFATSCAANASLARHLHENPLYLALVLEAEGFPTAVLPAVQERLNELFRTDKKYRGAQAEVAVSDSAEEMGDDPEEHFLTHGKAGALSDQQKQGKAYRQLQFMAGLISNWRVVLGEMNDPEILKALDRLFQDEEDLASINESFVGKPGAEAWSRLRNVVDEDVVNSVVEYTNAIADQEIADPAAVKSLVHQSYRRAFVNRVINLMEQYHSLKDVPANSVYEFSMDSPYTELDFSVIQELFPSEDASLESAERSAESRRERVSSFQQSLRSRLGRVIKNIPEVSNTAPLAQSGDATSSSDWDMIARKYYRAPKSKLAQRREEWLESLNEGDNEYTRMQDIKQESLLKAEYKKR